MPVPTPLISRSRDRLGCAAVLAGTRVLDQTFIEYPEGTDLLDAVLADFSTASGGHAAAVLKLAN